MAQLGITTTVTLDCGAVPVDSASVVVPCVGCTPNTDARGWMSSVAPAGKDADDVGMDSYSILLLPEIDQTTITLRGLEGYISGKFVIRFCIG